MTATADRSACQRRGRGWAVLAVSRGSVVSAIGRSPAGGSLVRSFIVGDATECLVAQLGPAHDLEIGILERRSMRSNEGQRSLDRPEQGVSAGGRHVDPERSFADRLATEANDLGPERPSVLGVHQEVLI